MSMQGDVRLFFPIVIPLQVRKLCFDLPWIVAFYKSNIREFVKKEGGPAFLFWSFSLPKVKLLAYLKRQTVLALTFVCIVWFITLRSLVHYEAEETILIWLPQFLLVLLSFTKGRFFRIYIKNLEYLFFSTFISTVSLISKPQTGWLIQNFT